MQIGTLGKNVLTCLFMCAQKGSVGLQINYTLFRIIERRCFRAHHMFPMQTVYRVFHYKVINSCFIVFPCFKFF